MPSGHVIAKYLAKFRRSLEDKSRSDDPKTTTSSEFLHEMTWVMGAIWENIIWEKHSHIRRRIFI